MGWMHCGEDSKGRLIGYGEPAVCDFPGCSEQIDRGMAHACGGMHGESDGCEGYFCSQHRSHYLPENLTESVYGGSVCAECYDEFVKQCGPICPECAGDGKTGMGGVDTCQSCEGSGLQSVSQ